MKSNRKEPVIGQAFKILGTGTDPNLYLKKIKNLN